MVTKKMSNDVKNIYILEKKKKKNETILLLTHEPYII